MTVYLNPQAHSNDLLNYRLKQVDEVMQAFTYSDSVPLAGGEPGPVKDLVIITNRPDNISHDDIRAIIEAPVSQGEIDGVVRLNSSKSRVSNVPNWATWDEQDALDWFNANLSDSRVDAITNLAEAKVMLKRQNVVIFNYGQILIALRDRIWPDLGS